MPYINIYQEEITTEQCKFANEYNQNHRTWFNKQIKQYPHERSFYSQNSQFLFFFLFCLFQQSGVGVGIFKRQRMFAIL